MSVLVRELEERLGAGAVLTDAADLAPFVTDWRGELRGQATCVVRPRDVTEVALTVSLSRAHGVAIVPQGGNTGLVGGATPIPGREQIVLSLTRMNAVRSVDRVAMTIEVEAGCVLETARQSAGAV